MSDPGYHTCWVHTSTKRLRGGDGRILIFQLLYRACSHIGGWVAERYERICHVCEDSRRIGERGFEADAENWALDLWYNGLCWSQFSRRVRQRPLRLCVNVYLHNACQSADTELITKTGMMFKVNLALKVFKYAFTSHIFFQNADAI